MNKMTFIGWIGLTALACQSNTEGYQIKGNIEGAGNGIAIMTLPVGREEPTTGDTVKMKNGVFTFTGKLEAPSWVSHPSLSGQGKTGILWFYAEKINTNHSRWKMG